MAVAVAVTVAGMGNKKLVVWKIECMHDHGSGGNIYYEHYCDYFFSSEL